MALHHDRHGARARPRDDLLRAVVFAVLVIGLMVVATLIFGINVPGPSLEFAPDPAGAMPF
ncbi:MAG TPA: hypothetical protein VFO73_07590 [Candidatus Limnocylindrales bacterium]|nr:hypothetical protein [Candidatus Limnocylindrales bacterium]